MDESFPEYCFADIFQNIGMNLYCANAGIWAKLLGK
jgi:hypothetical protein